MVTPAVEMSRGNHDNPLIYLELQAPASNPQLAENTPDAGSVRRHPWRREFSLPAFLATSVSRWPRPDGGAPTPPLAVSQPPRFDVSPSPATAAKLGSEGLNKVRRNRLHLR